MQKLSEISKKLSDPRVGGERRFYFSFAGGGAKGIVHVGALGFIEKNDYDISGLAGTSAGAIIASLKAIGYSADEILNSSGASQLFMDISKTRACKQAFPSGISNIADLFGDGLLDLKSLKRNWRKGRWARVIWGIFRLAPEIKMILGVVCLNTVFLAFSLYLLFNSNWSWFAVGFSLWVLLTNLTKDFSFRKWQDLGYRLKNGLVDVKIFKNVFDELICQKIGMGNEQRAKFSDLPFDLRIIATDLSRGEPILFSPCSR